jgi:Zn-dependent protease with chaperone function
MPEHGRHDLHLLVGLPVIAMGLSVAALVALGSQAAGQASLAILGTVGACYRLFTLAFAAPAPALIAEVVLVVSVGLACRSALRQVLHTRRGIRPLVALARPTQRLGQACEQVGANRTVTLELPASMPASFCAGLLRRRIIVTSALADALTEEELAAVIAHETHHLRCFDPARLLLARCVAAAFFWLPAVVDLQRRYALRQELAADHAAIRLVGRRALAAALLKAGGPCPAGTVSFGAGALAVRVDALLGRPVRLPALSRARLVITAAVLGADAGLVVWASQSGPVRHGVPLHALLPMLRSPSVHGLLGMTAFAVANGAALGLASRVWAKRCGG